MLYWRAKEGGTEMDTVCAFSGHRPERLPWGSDESDPRCQALKIQLEEKLRDLCREGCRTYLCGMARGTDLYYLEALTRLRAEFPLTIEAVIPCPSQSDRWPVEEQRRYLRLLGRCDSMKILEEHYSEGCMLRRNRYMVEHADVLVTVFDGSPSGTAATVRYAEARGLRIVPLWL